MDRDSLRILLDPTQYAWVLDARFIQASLQTTERFLTDPQHWYWLAAGIIGVSALGALVQGLLEPGRKRRWVPFLLGTTTHALIVFLLWGIAGVLFALYMATAWGLVRSAMGFFRAGRLPMMRAMIVVVFLAFATTLQSVMMLSLMTTMSKQDPFPGPDISKIIPPPQQVPSAK